MTHYWTHRCIDGEKDMNFRMNYKARAARTAENEDLNEDNNRTPLSEPSVRSRRGRRRLLYSLPTAETKRVKTKPSTEPAKLVVEDEEIIESLAVEVSIHVCMPFRMQRNDSAPEN